MHTRIHITCGGICISRMCDPGTHTHKHTLSWSFQHWIAFSNGSVPVRASSYIRQAELGTQRGHSIVKILSVIYTVENYLWAKRGVVIYGYVGGVHCLLLHPSLVLQSSTTPSPRHKIQVSALIKWRQVMGRYGRGVSREKGRQESGKSGRRVYGERERESSARSSHRARSTHPLISGAGPLNSLLAMLSR